LGEVLKGVAGKLAAPFLSTGPGMIPRWSADADGFEELKTGIARRHEIN
jgi:hypothetical protein